MFDCLHTGCPSLLSPDQLAAHEAEVHPGTAFCSPGCFGCIYRSAEWAPFRPCHPTRTSRLHFVEMMNALQSLQANMLIAPKLSSSLDTLPQGGLSLSASNNSSLQELKKKNSLPEIQTTAGHDGLSNRASNSDLLTFSKPQKHRPIQKSHSIDSNRESAEKNEKDQTSENEHKKQRRQTPELEAKRQRLPSLEHDSKRPEGEKPQKQPSPELERKRSRHPSPELESTGSRRTHGASHDFEKRAVGHSSSDLDFKRPFSSPFGSSGFSYDTDSKKPERSLGSYDLESKRFGFAPPSPDIGKRPKPKTTDLVDPTLKKNLPKIRAEEVKPPLSPRLKRAPVPILEIDAMSGSESDYDPTTFAAAQSSFERFQPKLPPGTPTKTIAQRYVNFISKSQSLFVSGSCTERSPSSDFASNPDSSEITEEPDLKELFNSGDFEAYLKELLREAGHVPELDSSETNGEYANVPEQDVFDQYLAKIENTLPSRDTFQEEKEFYYHFTQVVKNGLENPKAAQTPITVIERALQKLQTKSRPKKKGPGTS